MALTEKIKKSFKDEFGIPLEDINPAEGFVPSKQISYIPSQQEDYKSPSKCHQQNQKILSKF